MGAPSQQQIDNAIAEGLARGEDEDAILDEVSSLTRLSDEELAELGIHPACPEPVEGPENFDPVPVKHRHDGWTAKRQRAFIQCLAETGCVRTACAEVGLTPRSAYKLREHPLGRAFRSAWDHATSLATTRLTSIAFDRAINGTPERIYRNGELFEERRRPSDRLLMWLLAHHNPVDYGWLAKPPKEPADQSFYLPAQARKQMPKLLGKLADIAPDDCPAEGVEAGDFDTLDPPDSP
jgi:hypothetical protein